MNPIWKREFFARWRDGRSHLLLLALVLALALAAHFSYKAAVEYQPETFQRGTPAGGIGTYIVDPVNGGLVLYVPESLATRASRAGRALFQTLVVGNVGVWFVLAPLLTATGVARERERGLLESLQLSHMTPRSQILARAASALFYLLALQLVTLPVYFVAFSFGGISPGEIARAWLLVGATALCGVGLGLAFSSAASRPSGALFGVVALLVAWSVGGALGWVYVYSPWGLLGLGAWTQELCQILLFSHPVAVALQLADPNILQPNWLTPAGMTVWATSDVFPLCLAAWALIGLVGLGKASRDVTRSFPPSGWAGRNTLVEKWKVRRQARIEMQRQRASAKVEGALLADLPLDKLIRFKNPLLNREVKGRFRLRRASLPVWAGRTLVFLLAAAVWVGSVGAIFDAPSRRSAPLTLLFCVWLLGLALVGTFAASGFAREREAGTWEGVRLSLLSNWQIARTKWASPLVAFALLSCPLWLLIFAFMPWPGWDGVPFRSLATQLLVVVASLCLVSALANFISLRAKNTTSATCWTLGALFVAFAVFPVAWSEFGLKEACAKAVVGVPPTNNFDSPDYAWTQRQDVNELYTQETGRLSFSGSNAAQTQANYERFYQWCRAKQQQAARVALLSGSWNTTLVLSELLDPQRAGEGRVLDPDEGAKLALWHGVVCLGLSAVLLGFTVRRLGRRNKGTGG